MEQFLRDWSYLGIFLGILATGLGFPMPEELPVVLGGVLVADDKAVWWLMLPVCIVGVIIGDSFLYLIGRFWGPRLVEYPFIKKHLLTPERLKHIEDNFHNYGIRILLFARLTPGIRAPIFLTAGITRLPLMRFIVADGIYAIPGVSILFYLGFWLREGIVNLIQNEAGRVKWIVLLVAIGGVALYFAFRYFRRPMVTGDPGEMPKLMTETLEMTSKVIPAVNPHPEGHPHAGHAHAGQPHPGQSHPGADSGGPQEPRSP